LKIPTYHVGYSVGYSLYPKKAAPKKAAVQPAEEEEETE